MKKGLTELEKEVYTMISKGEAAKWKTRLLARELKISEGKVRNVIQSLRQKFRKNHPEVRRYIYLTQDGYTVKRTKDAIAYEAQFRLKLGFGVLNNGAHVIGEFKKSHVNDYNDIKVVYSPGKLPISDMFK